MGQRFRVFDAYQLYVEHIKLTNNAKTAQQIINEFRSVMIRLWLTEMGYQRKIPGRKMINTDVNSGLEYLKSLDVNALLVGRQTLQQAFVKMKISPSSQNTYGSRFEQFLIWCENQDWWPERSSRLAKIKHQCSPIIKNPHGGITNTPLIDRPGGTLRYGLTDEEINSQLQKELDNLFHYFTDSEYPGRVIGRIEESTSEHYLDEVLLVLGWFYRFYRPDLKLEDLSLDLLFPKLTSEQMEGLTKQQEIKFWKQEKQKLDNWLCGYLKFLREEAQSQSPRTRRQKLSTLQEVAKFQCLDLVEEEQDYANFSIFKLIRNYIKTAQQESNEWVKDRHYVTNQDKKWPAPPDKETALSFVQREVVERLRLECRFRDSEGRIRGSFCLAKEHQQYLHWYFLACQPARRQQEFRTLKVALCCPVQRPEFVPASGLYHPLPPNEVRNKQQDGSVKDNYLHKTYFHEQKHYSQGVWVLNIQDYKTRSTHGPQSIVIPNRQFADGNCLYDYLERYLYGWWEEVGYKNQQIYDWWQPELKGRRGQWLTKGRADFNPRDTYCQNTRKNSVQWSWGYFFLQPKVGTPYCDVAFATAFETSAHRFIGKRTSPHTMRYVWATWAFQVGLNDAQMRSLAYAMGHTLQSLRKLYERSTPQEKRRPIEEAIDELLFADLPSQESTKESVPHHEPEPDLDSLIESLGKLTPDERQCLIKALQNQS